MTDSKVQLAVFDFDGTLINIKSGPMFVNYLFRHRVLALSTWFKLLIWGIKYTLHVSKNQSYSHVLIIHDLTKHYTRQEIIEMVTYFHDEMLAKHYRVDAINQIRTCQKEGCTCVLLSANFDEFAHVAANYLGLKDYMGTTMEVAADGSYTGRVLGDAFEGKGKPEALAKWANQKFGDGNWCVKYAYGDTYSDRFILEQAEYPVAVSPDGMLTRTAKKHGWSIVKWK